MGLDEVAVMSIGSSVPGDIFRLTSGCRVRHEVVPNTPSIVERKADQNHRSSINQFLICLVAICVI